MITRRHFLSTSCAVGTALNAAAAEQGRAEAPSGLIDCQSHLFCPELLALMEKRTADPVVYTADGVRYLRMGDWLRKVPPLYLDVDAKLATMDACGISLTALSINDPGPEWFGKDGPAVAQMANDFVAGVVRKHPARFFGLCVLPLQDMNASLVELDRCVGKLGMKGILLYTILQGNARRLFNL